MPLCCDGMACQTQAGPDQACRRGRALLAVRGWSGGILDSGILVTRGLALVQSSPPPECPLNLRLGITGVAYIHSTEAWP